MMASHKVGLLLAILAVGCLAIPRDMDDLSDLFIHAESEGRIIGGNEAAKGSVPYMVALTTGQYVKSFMCGGSLVTKRHVLTAAHCVAAVYSSGSLKSSLRVTVGTNRWNQGGQSYTLSHNYTHPHYVRSIIKNDVGVLVTSSNVALSKTVQLVPLSFDYVGAGVVTKATGWGDTKYKGPISQVLLELKMKTTSGQQCKKDMEKRAREMNWKMPSVNPILELCVFHSEGHGMCNGDSGSALVRTDNGKQIGIVSWGMPCARNAPDVFVRVSAYKEWILKAIE